MWRTTVRSLVLASPEGFCHTADCPGVSPQGHRRNTRAGMQSPAAMVAAPNEGGGVTPLSVTVPGSTVTVQLNKMKLREADMLTMLRHNTLMNAGLTKMGLRSIVNDGVPPALMRTRVKAENTERCASAAARSSSA
jgi:hypothetical protein